MNVARVMLIVVGVCVIVMLCVSFDSTRRVGSLFHETRGLDWAFAFALEVGIALCGFGASWRAAHKQNVRTFKRVLVSLLVISFVANGLAGGHSMALHLAYLAMVGIMGVPAIIVAALLTLAFGAVVPVIIWALLVLFANLLSEVMPPGDEQVSTTTGADDLVVRIVSAYARENALAQAQLAALLGVSVSRAQRARAKALEAGFLRRIGPGQYAPADEHEVQQ